MLTIQILSELIDNLPQENMLNPIWNWFISNNGGLNSCILGLNRHSFLNKNFVDLFIKIGKNNLVELFTLQFRNSFPDEKQYLLMINLLFEPLKIHFDENAEVFKIYLFII